MAKVLIKNFAEHDFELPGVNTAEAPGGAAVGKITFPRNGVRTGADGVGIETPGQIEVDESVVERMKAHVVCKSWLGPDERGRPQLVVGEKVSDKEAEKADKAAEKADKEAAPAKAGK